MAESADQDGPATSIAVIVLAAGAGTRMKSHTPKPLHKVAGLPMLEHVLRAVEQLNPPQVVVVASPELDVAIRTADLGDRHTVVVQHPPRGTGDAVVIGLQAVCAAESALIVYADHPLVASSDLQALITKFQTELALVGVMTCVVDDAAGYGRIERDESKTPVAIVEQVADDPKQRDGPIEINSGIMVLGAAWASQALLELPPNPVKNELFLTDLVAIAAKAEDHPCPVVTVSGPASTLIGVNDRAELAVADDAMRHRIRTAHMRAGVTVVGPETVFIDADVSIGADTTILPNSMIHSGVSIGERCIIGPRTSLERANVGDDSQVEASVVRDCQIGRFCHVGPFSHLRDGTILADHVHIGNYVEAKNATFATGVRAGHVSYLGDASIGESTNIGAGTVTCNFDGVDKHHTVIGANAFIGSDSMLIAPLMIGDRASTGAGSVVTRDVEPGVTVVGMPARPIRRRGVKTASQNTGEGV